MTRVDPAFRDKVVSGEDIFTAFLNGAALTFAGLVVTTAWKWGERARESSRRSDEKRADAYTDLVGTYAECDLRPATLKGRLDLAIRLDRAHRVAHLVASDEITRAAIDGLAREALLALGQPTDKIDTKSPAYTAFLQATDKELAGR